MKRPSVLMIAGLAGLLAAALVIVLAQGDTQGREREGGRRRSGRVARADAVTAMPAEHPRVVALAPGPARIVRDLGLSSLLVGRHAYDPWSDQDLPVCGDQGGIDYERLIAQHPTHVLLQWGDRELPQRLIQLSQDRGWVVVNLPLLSLGDVTSALQTINETVVKSELAARRWDRATNNVVQSAPGEAPLASATMRLIETFEESLRHDAKLARAGRVMLLYQESGVSAGASGRPAVLGPGSYHHDLLLRIGGLSVVDEGKPFMSLDVEDMASLAPEGLVLVRPRRPGSPTQERTPEQIREMLGPMGRLELPAFTSGRVAVIDDEMALVPGTNLGAFADQLRGVLARWANVPVKDPPARETWPPR